MCTTICRSMQVDIEVANKQKINGPLTITVDFLKLKLCFKFPFYLMHIYYSYLCLNL